MGIEAISRSSSVTPPFMPSITYKQDPTYFLPEKTFTARLSKPEIAHPSTFIKSIVCNLAQFLERIRSIEHIYFDILEREMDRAHEVVSANLEEQIKHYKNVKKEGEASDWWDYLRKIAVCFFGAATIVLGATLLGPQATVASLLAGCAMIISGSATLLGNTLYDMNTHPQAATALMIVGSSFGLIGGAASAIKGIGSLTEMLGRVAVASLSVVSNSAEAMQSVHKWKISDLKASYTLIQKASEVCREIYRAMEKDLSFYEETITRSTESCINAQMRHDAVMKKIATLSGPLSAG